ncbi:MAG: hypothetical protein GF409_04070 [Candidatus Omnitrophica bacterium]|nr:hypothetical protein [Candidatus Omnitrophota bacterium]
MYSKSPKRSLFLKAVSVFLVLTFSMYNISYAVTQDNLEPAGIKQDMPLSVEDIGIAIDCGTVKNRFNGNDGKVIVHIQDAHCNYEAQSNINKMLDQLTRECEIDMISVEGAEGIVDTTWFRAFPDSEIRKEVATYFMKKGEITGAEFFSITSEYQGTIFGAETRDYYVKNLRAFTEVYPYKETIEKYFTDARTVSNRLKSIVYTPKLKELDLKIRSFDEKQTELSDYAAYLNKTAEQQRIDLKDLEDFKKLVQTLEYEEKIDFDIVDQERSKYIDVLSKKMDKEKMTELVTQSIRFKKGHIKAVDFYSYLRELAKEHDIDMVHEYQNLFYYYIYTKLYEGIDNERLFKEIDTIEARLKESFFENGTQRKLDKYSNMLDMFIDLINIELTNDDYDLFKGYSEEFTLEEVLDFMTGLVERYNLNYTVDGMPLEIKNNIPKMVDFYEIAIKRDNALIENTLKQMQQEGKNRCVLIAGGFHTRGIKHILEKKGVSYVVVTPKITKNVETPYIKVLTNQRTSLEDIITESAAVPGIGITATREEIVRPKGDMLSPLLRVAYTIPMYLEDPEALKKLSDATGHIPESESLFTTAEGSYKEMVTLLVRGWLVKVREKADPEVWKTAVGDWHLLLGAFLKKYEEEAAKQGTQVIAGLKIPAPVLTEEMLDAISGEFRAIFRDEVVKSVTPGTETVDTYDIYPSLTSAQADGYNEVIRPYMEATPDPVKIFTFKIDGRNREIKVFALENLKDAVEEYNLDPVHGEELPLTVEVHPGRGLGHDDPRLYISAGALKALNDNQLKRLAKHELYHILLLEKGEAYDEEKVIEMMGGDNLMDIRVTLARVEEQRQAVKAEEAKRVHDSLIKSSLDMAEATSKGIGPDVVIIVSSSDEQADFWQERLTGDDNKTGSGEAVKEGAVVLSVSESNWKGGAGNGMGTLNGFVQAARKANSLGLIDVDSYASVTEFIDAMLTYCKGKAAFMFHTAGKGTRTAPLPGAEVNSKPNIKLPKMVDVKGQQRPLTILEAVLMETNIYAPSRTDRLGVFWGDQVVINENDISFGGKHHVEIFGQLVPLDPDIKSYGVLIPGEEGDCKQREKLSMDEVKKLLPEGSSDVYKSIGSFTISLPFLEAMIMMPEHKKLLESESGSLNTDPDWWQPLTSTRDEYIEMIGKKGVSRAKAGQTWDRMQDLWVKFVASDNWDPDSGLYRQLGFNDVGKNSLWWDYGQNKFYLRNMQILTEYSPEGEAARNFFDAEITDSKTDQLEIEKSVIKNSDVKRGRLVNCVVIDSQLEEVYAENAVIIGSVVLKLNAEDALCYNVVSESVNLAPGQVLANIFHPKLGRIPMRTDIGRDGSADWKGGVHVYDNAYTYSKIAELMKGLKMEEVMETKKKAISAVRIGLDWAGRRQDLTAQNLSDKRNIGISEARHIVAHRMLTFGDVPYFTVASYAKLFNVSPRQAGEELEDLASAEREGAPTSGVESLEAYVTLTKGKLSDLVDQVNEQGLITAPEKKMLDDAIAVAKDIESLSFIYAAMLNEKGYLNKIDTGVEDAVVIYRKVPTQNRKDVMEQKKPLKFGTSGLRDTVDNMTDLECYINTRGFIKFLKERGEIRFEEGGPAPTIVVGGDRRPSTPRIMLAVIKAIEDEGCAAEYIGLAPSPTVAYYAMQKGLPSVMVTGSHIPADRNGIKFTKKSGEVLKTDETDILKNVAIAREEESEKGFKASDFGREGLFKAKRDLPDATDKGIHEYVKRYLGVFPSDALKGKKIVLYQHSAVGRDIVQEIFEGLGAEVIVEQRSEEFVPVDTEKVPESSRKLFKEWAAKHEPDFIIFTDGDSDRPGFVDEKGNFLSGDSLGALVSMYLEPDSVAIPTSANDAVVDALKNKGIDVTQTRIGSPYVIAAMNHMLEKNPDAKVASWESNGGYLLGSEVKIGGKSLKPLPTRDAVLPLLLPMLLSIKEGKTASEMIATNLPARVVVSDAVNNKMEGTEAYTPDMGKAIVKKFSPEDSNIAEYDFNRNVVTYKDDLGFLSADSKRESAPAELIEQMQRIRDTLGEYFTNSAVDKLTFIDGIKMHFENNDGIHIRPSGNEPILRFYVQAPTQKRAQEIVDNRLEYIRPIVQAMATPGTEAVRTDSESGKAIAELDERIKAGKPVRFVPSFRTGADGYTWGQPVEENVILEIMGARTPEEKVALAHEYGIPPEEVIGERWVAAGQVDTDMGVKLPSDVLSLWPDQMPGSNITAKLLTSGRPLSLQYHRFPEMIIPLADGYAYLGLNRDVTPEEFMDNLRKGDVSMFNRVDLKKGEPVIVPPFMIHAYGLVRVYEVKAVDAAQDKAGTISFYDRLRLTPEQQEIVAQEVAFTPPEAVADKLVAKGLARPGKDVLTLPADTVQAIADELQREGSLKKSDLSVAAYTPVVQNEVDGAKYEKMGEAPGFVAGRYMIDELKGIEVYSDIQGKQHSIIVTEGAVKLVNAKGETVDEVSQGEERVIPANAGKYSVIATRGPATVYTQYVPEQRREEEFAVEVERGRETIPNLPDSVPSFVDNAIFSEEGIRDLVEINSAADAMPLLEGRDHVVAVVTGKVALELNEKQVAVFDEGDSFMVSDDQIIDTKGRIIPFLETGPYRLVKEGDRPATVEIRYANTPEERIVYMTYMMVKKHMDSIQAGQVDLILPSEMFVPGGENTPGSALWEQKQLQTYISEKIRISTYNASMGLSEAAKKSLNKGAVGILVATESNIRNADRDDPEVRKFLYGEKGKLRVLAIPDLDGLEEDQGWFFNREVEGTALLLAALNPEDIQEVIANPFIDNAAKDLQKLMAQLTGKSVPARYLYYMLSRDEIGEAIEMLPADLKDDPYGWLRFLVQNLLLKMPIKPFDATEQLQQRRKVMWSV